MVISFTGSACAYWIWTPQSKKFVNPKYAVKDSPKEQFDWAMTFFDSKDYQRAAAEFEKLTKNYEYSEYAAKAQYYAGVSYELMGKFYQAFQSYQKTIDNFPNIENMDEIIEREYHIGNLYLTRSNPKIMGADIISSMDRAIEIMKRVVENAPYGRIADMAQFKLGEAYKKIEGYDEAIEAFQKVVDNYPKSEFYERARYEVAYCAYMASLNPAYASEPTDRAIKAFEDFAQSNTDDTMSKEAEATIQRLKDKAAEKSMATARFYDNQKRYDSALLYYEDVLERFPDSSSAREAKVKIEYLKKKRAK